MIWLSCFDSIIKWFIDIASPNNDMLEYLQALLAEYPTSPFVFGDARMAVLAIIDALLMNVVLLTYTWAIRRIQHECP